MRIFVTGATGFIGSAIVEELLAAGHQVLGLTRSDAGARALQAQGAEVHFGDIDRPDTLRRGAEQADAVIHTAFNHDFSTFVANCETDRRVIEAMGDALTGSQRPFIITSFVAMGATAPGLLATEDQVNIHTQHPRKASELAGMAVAERGVNVSFVRLPQVHDTRKQGLISPLIALAREKGVSAWIDEGQNRWAAVHLSDAARVYVRALEKDLSGSRYNAVAEEGIALRTIAETIGRGLNVPVKSIAREDAAAHFGWLSAFVGQEMSASGALTQQRLNWHPEGPGLLASLMAMKK
nr:SDR family oxidoreductase [uncultured Enterobacter sp.]